MTKQIIKAIGLVSSLLLLPLPSFSVENPLFGYTHLLPSPFTIPAGKFIVGSTSGVGITDFLDVQTNLIADFYQIYNAQARASLLDFPGLAAAVSLGYQNVNLNHLASSNPSGTISSWMPGLVVGTEVLPYFAVFVGGNLFYSSTSIPDSSQIQSSGFLQGAQIESDVSWAYNPKKSSTGNVLSAGVSYNSTFNFYGFGVSHHWKGFQFGMHYYPNASNLKVFPIITGGAVVEL